MSRMYSPKPTAMTPALCGAVGLQGIYTAKCRLFPEMDRRLSESGNKLIATQTNLYAFE